MDLFLQQGHMFSMGLNSGLRKSFPRPQLNPDLTILLPMLMRVWDHSPVGTPNCTQDPICWLTVLDYPEEFRDNPPSSLFHVLSVEQNTAKQPHSIIHPTPCLTQVMVFLGLKGLTFSPPVMLAAHCGQTSQLLFCWPQSFPPAANYWWALVHQFIRLSSYSYKWFSWGYTDF